MQELHGGIDRVIKIARSLRDVAGELGKLDLKSQIIDEISTLQELRDDLDEMLKSAGGEAATTDSSEQVKFRFRSKFRSKLPPSLRLEPALVCFATSAPAAVTTHNLVPVFSIFF